MNRNDAYTAVVARLMQLMEDGTVPWRKPWTLAAGQRPHNLVSGRPYSGFNRVMLSMMPAGPGWCTFAQAHLKGWKIRKGAKGVRILFYSPDVRYEKNLETGEVEEREVAILKTYHVFAQQDLEGYTPPPVEPGPVFVPHERAEEILRGVQPAPRIRHDQQQAFYHGAQDFIGMPPRDSFNSPDAYYATVFHEVGHWTGHESRLNRPCRAGNGHYGSPTYSEEELVAEFTAAFVCHEAGITQELPQNAAYLQGWMQVFRDSPAVVVRAAKMAEAAASYILDGPPQHEAVAAVEQTEVAA